MQISGLPGIPMQSTAYEDEKGWLHVKTGPVVDTQNLAEQLWPVGSRMTVYYNPKKPKMNYVDRPITRGFIAVLYVIVGLVIVLIGLVVFFLILP